MAKKKSKSKIGMLLARTFNIKYWIDWSRLKSGGKFITKGAQRVFIATPEHPVETFEEAQKRLKLSTAILDKRSKALLRTSILMVSFAIFLLGFTIYHFIFGSIHSGIFSLSLMILALAFALRYHFWYFQITRRKLGCTLREWFHQGLMGEKQ